MTGDEEHEAVRRAHGPHRAPGAWVAREHRELAVGDDLAARDVAQRCDDVALERGARREVERHVRERDVHAREEGAQKLGEGVRVERGFRVVLALRRDEAVIHPCAIGGYGARRGARSPQGEGAGATSRAAPGATSPAGSNSKSCASTTPSPVQSSPTPQPSTTYRVRTARTAHRLYNRPHERPRNLPAAAAGQRADQLLCAGHARARRAAGTPAGDAGRAREHPDGHRRQGRPRGRDLRGRHAASQEPRPRRRQQGRPGARAAGDRRRPRGARRVVADALARARGRVPSRGRAPLRPVAHDAERGDDAQPVEDGPSGGDRRRRGDDRLLALQRRLHHAHLLRAAVLAHGHVEPAGVPAARGLRLRRQPVQLHVHRRQPLELARAHGQHGHLEAGLDGRALGLLPHADHAGGRPARRRDQPRVRLRRDDRGRGARKP